MTKNILAPQVTMDIGTMEQRRSLVMSLYGGYALFCFAVTIGLQMPNPIRLVGLVALLASFAMMWRGFFALTGLMFGARTPGAEDEDTAVIMQARRDTVKGRARPWVIAAVVVAAVYFILAIGFVPSFRSVPFIVAVMLGAFLIAATLPTTMIAWTEPDPAPNPFGEDPYAVIDHKIPSLHLFGE